MKKISQWLLFIFVAVLPFDFRAEFLPGEWAHKVRLVDFIFLVLICSWILLKISNRTPARAPLFWFLAVSLVVAALVSLAATFVDEKGIIQAFAMVYMVAIYFVTCDLLDSERLIRRLLGLWISIHVLLAAISLISITLYFFRVAVVGAQIWTRLTQVIPFPRAEGFSAGPNSFLLDIHWAMTAAFIFWIEKKIDRRNANLFLIAFMILWTVMFFTVSRGILGSLFAMGLIGHSFREEKALRICRNILIGLCVLMIPVVSFFTVWVVIPFQFPNWNHAWSPYFLMARSNFDMIKDHWLWGIGVGHLQHWLPVYSAQYLMDEYAIYETRESFNRLNPMSLYLGWFVQTGVWGLTVLGLFLVSWLRKLRQARQTSILFVFFYSALAGFLVQGIFTDFIFSRSFWVFLGIAAASLWTIPKQDNLR